MPPSISISDLRLQPPLTSRPSSCVWMGSQITSLKIPVTLNPKRRHTRLLFPQAIQRAAHMGQMWIWMRVDCSLAWKMRFSLPWCPVAVMDSNTGPLLPLPYRDIMLLSFSQTCHGVNAIWISISLPAQITCHSKAPAKMTDATFSLPETSAEKTGMFYL